REPVMEPRHLDRDVMDTLQRLVDPEVKEKFVRSSKAWDRQNDQDRW
ncbi:MAG: hypothetical protein JWR59_1308, partial [Brevundimonas sp.]|nr:hypothetical protein [Brevundimonas sp.]